MLRDQKSRHRPDERISYINVTGFLSIMVVLVALFMVRTDHDLPRNVVNLPKVAHPAPMPNALREDALIVSVQRDGRVWVGDDQVRLTSLPAAIQERLRRGAEKKVYVRADARARYKTVTEVVDAIHAARVENIAFLADEKKP